MKKKHLQMLLFIIFLVGVIVAFILRLDKKISLSYLQEHTNLIKQAINDYYALCVIGYVACYVLFVILMVPLTILLNVAAGYFFGVIPGTIYSVLGCVAGSFISMLLFRYIFRSWAHKKYHAKLGGVEDEFNKHGAEYILSLQLFPITPFAVINSIAGLSELSAWKFLLITFIGVTPYIFLNAYAGTKLTTLNNVSDILSPGFLVLFLGLSLCAIAPTVWQHFKKKRKRRRP